MKSKLTEDIEKFQQARYTDDLPMKMYDWLVDNGEELLAILNEHDRGHIPVGTRVRVNHIKSMWFGRTFIVKDSYYGSICAISADFGASALPIYFPNEFVEVLK